MAGPRDIDAVYGCCPNDGHATSVRNRVPTAIGADVSGGQGRVALLLRSTAYACPNSVCCLKEVDKSTSNSDIMFHSFCLDLPEGKERHMPQQETIIARIPREGLVANVELRVSHRCSRQSFRPGDTHPRVVAASAEGALLPDREGGSGPSE